MLFRKKRLNQIEKHLIINLLTDSAVKRHMPLSSERFGDKEYIDFITAKEKIWQEYGFGPSGYFVEDQFIGWAGLQPDEGDDFEVAIVLDPRYWGYGIQIYKELIKFAFDTLNLNSVTILFPPSRTRIKAILREGFIKENEVLFNDELFIRYRLVNNRNPK